MAAGIIATNPEDDSGLTKVLTPDCERAVFAIKFRSLSIGASGDIELSKNMKVQYNQDVLLITGIKELGATNANSFRDQVRASINEGHKFIEIDLSETMFLDSCGLGALISLHKTICARQGLVRLVNPTPPVQQILELTRMHRIFEIIKR